MNLVHTETSETKIKKAYLAVSPFECFYDVCTKHHRPTCSVRYGGDDGYAFENSWRKNRIVNESNKINLSRNTNGR